MITVPIHDVKTETPRSRIVTIDLLGDRVEFQPGQAVIMGVHGRQDRRPYSIACSPEQSIETGQLEILLGVDADGTVSLGAFGPGTLMDIEGPVGTFVLPSMSNARWFLFVAGGTGIAPLRSMLDHLIREHPEQRMSLLYSARRGDEFAFIDKLHSHAKAGRLELHQTVTRDDSASWTGRRGRIDRAHFEAVLHEPAATLSFVCGPESLVDESMAMLLQLGVPAAQIKTESWGK